MDELGPTGELIMMVVAGVFYLFPTIMAYQRSHLQKQAIFALNLFLGWSVIGWVGALIWTLTRQSKQ